MAMDEPTGKVLPQRPEPSPERTGSENALDEGDLHLLRWMLELTSTERLRAAEGFVNDVLKLRNARRA